MSFKKCDIPFPRGESADAGRCDRHCTCFFRCAWCALQQSAVSLQARHRHQQTTAETFGVSDEVRSGGYEVRGKCVGCPALRR